MRRGALSLFVALAGCGGEASSGADGGPDPDTGPDAAPDSGPAEPIAPDEPVPPALPVLTPCLEGWREVVDPTEPGLVICEPWPEGGPSPCADDELQLPGAASCEPIGPACPAGDYAKDLPAGATIVYVRPGAVGGDGTEALPFGSVGEAIVAAPDEAVVALAKGTYDEVVELDRPLTLWGACVEQTVLDASSALLGQPAVALGGRARGVRNVTITGAGRGLAVTDAEEPVDLVALSIRDVTGVALSVEGGALVTISALAVRRVSPRLGVGTALELTNVAQVVLDGAVFESSGYNALVATSGADVQASRVVFRGTTTRPGTDDAACVVVTRAVVTLAEAVFDRCADYGIVALGPAVVDATDVVFQDGVPDLEDLRGAGAALDVQGLATVRLYRARLDRSTVVAAGLTFGDVIFTDVVIRDTRPRAGANVPPVGYAIEMTFGGTAELIRVLALGSHGAALASFGDGLIAASDLVARGTRAISVEDELLGAGLYLLQGRADLLRARVEDSDVCGILVSDGETVLAATDLELTGGGASVAEGLFGQGLCASGGAHVELRHARLAGNRTAALDLRGEGTAVTGTDVVLEGTLPQAASGAWGAGAVVLDGARLEVERMSIMRTAWAGVLVQGAGSAAGLQQLVVESTGTDGRGEGGVGVAALAGGAATVDQFLVDASASCGLLWTADASLTAREGLVEANGFGVCAPPGSDPIGGPEGRVWLVDNDRDAGDPAVVVLDATDLPAAPATP